MAFPNATWRRGCSNGSSGSPASAIRTATGSIPNAGGSPTTGTRTPVRGAGSSTRRATSTAVTADTPLRQHAVAEALDPPPAEQDREPDHPAVDAPQRHVLDPRRERDAHALAHVDERVQQHDRLQPG